MKEKTIHEIMVYINLNLFEHITLDILSSRYSYSKYYIHRQFKKVTGITINEYVKKRRIEHSLYYLFANIDANLSEVAEYCGFSSAVYSREFKKTLNKSPKEWRDIYKKNNDSSNMSKICKNYAEFLDYNDNGISKEIKTLNLVCIEQKKLSAEIIYGNYTAKLPEISEKLKILNKEESALIGIPINSASVTDINSCLYVLGFESGSYISELSDIVIEGGDYLKIEFIGSMEKLKETMIWLLKFYMPSKKLKHDYRMQFIAYHNFLCSSKTDLSCDIYIPYIYY